MTLQDMEQKVLEALRSFKNEEITDKEFLEWFEEFVVKELHAKLPLREPGTQTPPEAKR